MCIVTPPARAAALPTRRRPRCEGTGVPCGWCGKRCVARCCGRVWAGCPPDASSLVHSAWLRRASPCLSVLQWGGVVARGRAHAPSLFFSHLVVRRPVAGFAWLLCVVALLFPSRHLPVCRRRRPSIPARTVRVSWSARRRCVRAGNQRQRRRLRRCQPWPKPIRLCASISLNNAGETSSRARLLLALCASRTHAPPLSTAALSSSFFSLYLTRTPSSDM